MFYTNVNGKTLLISASGLYVLLAVLFRAAAAHGIRGERIPIRVSLMGRTVALMALRDTGHRLRDISGNPVLTVELRCFPQLAAEVFQLPAVEALPLLRRKYPELRPQLLPIHTAAGSGLLLSVKSDWASIDEQCYPGIRIALVKTELGSGYTALWGGERSQDYVELGVEAAVPAAAVPGAGGALHRRQRHPAAALEPGTGSGTAGAAGRGACPAGADRA